VHPRAEQEVIFRKCLLDGGGLGGGSG